MSTEPEKPYRRRLRYRGTHPRRFTEKYKELDPERDPETIEKVLASGKTPAGQHRPIMVEEILERLAPQAGERGVDATLGYGGHAEKLLETGASLLGLDADPLQLPKTEARLRGLGHDGQRLIIRRSNYAGLVGVLAKEEWSDGVDFLLADLGLSSMQLDNPERGFSYKNDGPLDMRMNPERGVSAADWLAKCKLVKLGRALEDGGDEPMAEQIAEAIQAALPLATTRELRKVIEQATPEGFDDDARKATVTRVFQAIRIAVNEEFTALDAFLAQLPRCLRPGGRVAILTFHSGEDRRVKHHFKDGLKSGDYAEVARDVVRASGAEIGGNPRAAPAKLRWAVRA